MNILLSILFLNITLLQNGELNRYSTFVQKDDSCLNAEKYAYAVKYYSKVEEMGMEFNTEEQKKDFYPNYSNALYTIGNYNEIHISHQKLKVIPIQNQDTLYEGKAPIATEYSLKQMTDNVNFIQEISKSIEMFKNLQDTSNLIVASKILAGIYVSVGKFNDAQEIYNEMLDIAIQSNDSTNIACNFEYLGVINYYKGNYKEAINHYNKSLEINRKLNNSFAGAINLSNLAESYMELGEHNKALKMLHKAEKLQKEINYKSVLTFSYYTLGKIYTQLEYYDSGIIYYEKTLKLMGETSETSDKNEVYRLTAENYEKQGDFQKAYEYYQKFSAHKDSLIASVRAIRFDEIKTRDEVENKIKENKDLLIQNFMKEEKLEAQQSLIQLQYTIGILIIIFFLISLFLGFKLYRARRTLLNANNSKDKLFGIIAHDLKGPIGNIGAMLKMLQVEQNEEIKSQYINYLNQSIQNLSTLTNQLLSWTFSHKGDFNFNIKKLSVRKIADRTIELFEFQLAEKNISVIDSIDEHLYVLADKNALQTIIRNILSNAIKFTKKGGEIKLEAEKTNHYVEVKIHDNGVGMSTNAIQNVLEGKHLKSSIGTDNERGSGLGFSIVIEFIKKLNGKIDIQSIEGKGTTIILKLKRATS